MQRTIITAYSNILCSNSNLCIIKFNKQFNIKFLIITLKQIF